MIFCKDHVAEREDVVSERQIFTREYSTRPGFYESNYEWPCSKSVTVGVREREIERDGTRVQIVLPV